MRRAVCAVHLTAVLGAFALGGCDAVAPTPSTERPGASTCGTEVYQSLVGQPVQRFLETRPERDRPLRLIRPGDAITKDYRLDRLNVDLDEDDVILRLWCG